jgi:hypothetical protein
MFARRVSLDLKSSSNVADFTEMFEKEVLPMLRKQKGFKDELMFVQPGGTKAFGISLWDRKEDAEVYGRDTYPAIEKILSKFVEGSARVASYDVRNSTYHKIGMPVTV